MGTNTDPADAVDVSTAGVAPSATRTDHWFDSDGTRCAAWFYPAHGVDGAAPVVVMGHGLGGTRQMRLGLYAERFAAAGIAAVVFDYRGFGDSGGSPRQIVDVKRQLADWHAALRWVRSGALPVDTARVAIWGTSFGGGHVMSVAAEDAGVAAVVAQCPFTDGIASVWRRFLANPLSAAVLSTVAVLDAVLGRLGRPPLLVPMAGVSWMPAFLASPDSLSGAASQLPDGSRMSVRSSRWLRRLPGVRSQVGDRVALSDDEAPAGTESVWGTALLPNGATVINAIAARLVLTLAAYRPGRSLRRTGSTPILVCVCDRDSVAPPAPTVRAARGLANVQLRHYDRGHFDIYLGDAFEHASAEQTAFLRSALHLDT